MPIPIWALRFGRNQTIKKAFAPTELNVGENEVIEEMKNPNSPMHKDVSEWDDWDRYRAENSPSYKYNYYLQQQVDQYNKNIIEKHLQDWRERDKLKKRW